MTGRAETGGLSVSLQSRRMEREHDPVRRGVSCTGHKAMTPDATISDRTSPDSWEKDKHGWVSARPALTSIRPPRKTNLSRSASLSEKELKEARTRSQIIAAQLTVPSNPNSKGVQLFNRRRQRVNAFTLVSVAGPGESGERQDEPDSLSPSALIWDEEHLADGPSGDFIDRKEKRGRVRSMKEAGEVQREASDVERHFLPVNEKDEEIPEELPGELGEVAKNDVTVGGDADNAPPAPNREGQEEAKLNGAYRHLENGSQATESSGKGATQSAIANRTARPFFSTAALTLAGPSISSPTQSQPRFAAPSRQVFSPPPQAPSYQTPPTFPSDPHPPSAASPPPAPNSYACRPAYAPQLLPDRSDTPGRSGVLDEGRARRATRKSMFTFQEKPKLSPNPDLLSLVQRTDEMKRGRGQAETQPEEEQLALGAEASNFLAKDDPGVQEAAVPEWASTLRNSQTRPRVEHKPEQALTGASGKGAELFAKRQTRMERYVSEKADELRSPSPTTSLPPSWVYPSNMPGRVKAIISSSNISAEISKTLQAQHTQQKNFSPRAPAAAPPPVLESPVLENGCSRIEMELSRHQPYQLDSSLFILNPRRDPISTLPKAAPPPKPVLTGSSYSRQTSLPTPALPTQYDAPDAYRTARCFSPPAIGAVNASPAPERVASPRSGVQAPKPSFSAKKAGITPQLKEASPVTPPSTFSNSPSRWTPNLSRRLSSSSGSDKTQSAVWTPQSQRSSTVTSPPPRTVFSPVTTLSTPRLISNSVPSSPPPRSIQKTVTSSPTPQSIQKPTCCSPTPRPFHNPVQSIHGPVRSFQSPVPTGTGAATTPVSPPWETRCKSPSPLQDTKANHRLLAKNIINAAKRKNSPSPGALSRHGLPMSPVSAGIILPFESKPSSPFHSHSLGAQSPTFTSPPATPTRMVHSPLRLYTTRSLTDSDASLESEDSGVRSPGVRTYNACPRGWTGSLRLKRVGVSEDL